MKPLNGEASHDDSNVLLHIGFTVDGWGTEDDFDKMIMLENRIEDLMSKHKLSDWLGHRYHGGNI